MIRITAFAQAAFTAAVICVPAPAAHADAGVDFAHEIVPLLRENCGKCHLEDARKGGFSMNTRELLLEGSENGPVVEPGQPDSSKLLEVIASDDPDVRMPPKGDPLPPEKIHLVRKWIASGLPWEPGFAFGGSSYEPPLRPERPVLPPAIDGRDHPVDRIIDAWMAARNIPRPPALDDAGFIRRLTLDLVGLLPDPDGVRAFVASTDPDKRRKLIEATLARDTDYAEHWLSFWNDLLRNDYEGTGYIDGGRTAITPWLYRALVTNMPYDRFARELLAPPSPESAGFINGIQWRGNVNASQVREIQFSQSISQTFLGLNMKCASCHDSFVDRWKLDEAYSLAAIYSERPLEIYRCDKPTGRTATAAWIFPELGQVDAAAPRPERLKQLAGLMTHPENGRFTRTLVNRLWHRLMGRGIVHPVDAMDTPPWNADLLNHLAVQFAEDGYDIRRALAHIVSSQAYQSQAVAPGKDAAGDYTFRGPLPKRLTAEQFVDAVWAVTGAAPAAPHAAIPRTKPGKPAGTWIWSHATASHASPAGEAIVLRRIVTLPATPEAARAVITCDNECRVLVNGVEAFRSDNWQEIRSVDLAGFRAGENSVTVFAVNRGTGPGAAGFYFEARFSFPGHDAVSVVSDASWEWMPGDSVSGSTAPDGPWKPAVAVQDQKVWRSAAGALAAAAAGLDGSRQPMVRASLLPADLLQRSLGRPNREQIVSMRPDTVTTLESIDLANGEQFAALLRKGAERYRDEAARSFPDLVERLYFRVLSRPPTSAEKSALVEAAAEVSPEQAVEDLLWTLFLLPEFQFVH